MTNRQAWILGAGVLLLMAVLAWYVSRGGEMTFPLG